MVPRNRSVRARLTSSEHRKLIEMSGRAGVTQSEFVRFLIVQEFDVCRFEEAINEMKDLIQELSEKATGEECLIIEVVLMMRELAAARNAQILARVNIKLDQNFGRDRRRI